MDNRYINKVLEELNPLFEEQGFKEKDGIFQNEKKAVKIDYNEDKQSYVLLVADIDEDGAQGELTELTSGQLVPTIGAEEYLDLNGAKAGL